MGVARARDRRNPGRQQVRAFVRRRVRLPTYLQEIHGPPTARRCRRYGPSVLRPPRPRSRCPIRSGSTPAWTRSSKASSIPVRHRRPLRSVRRRQDLYIDLAYHVALGQAWRGRRVQRSAVLYVGLEGARGLPHRMAAYAKHMQSAGRMLGRLPSTHRSTSPKPARRARPPSSSRQSA
jgi:AAA domain